jgi:hypothetical protein
MGARETRASESALAATGDSADLFRFARTRSARWRSLRAELARVWKRFGAFEWVAFGYLGFSSVMILVFARNLARTNAAQPWKLIGAQAIVAAIIFLVCSAGARAEEQTGRDGVTLSSCFWHFWRHWYPHLFFLICFEELAYLVHLVNPNWQDAKLIAFDYALLGVHPSVWLEQFATPLRNDFIQLAYLTYFVYLLVLGGILYYRKEWHAYWSVMTYSGVGYAIGYVIAAIFPIESPWFSMAGMWRGELHGGPFTATIAYRHYGRVRGAAFPRACGRLGGGAVGAGVSDALLGDVAVVAASFSTIWGRYHYVADIFGGLLTGTLGYVIGSWIMRRRGAVTVKTKRNGASQSEISLAAQRSSQRIQSVVY